MPRASETAKHRPTGRICARHCLNSSAGMSAQPASFAAVMQAEAKSMCINTSVAGYGKCRLLRMYLLKRMIELLKKTHCSIR